MSPSEELDPPKTQALPPAEGERRAMRGYVGQYERAGAAIYAELERGQLLWIGVADRSAGIADDLVLGFDGLVVGHQFKTSKFPGSFTVETLLTGADGLLRPLVTAWQGLCKSESGCRVEIRLVVNDYPSVNDKPGDVAPAHSAAFLEQFELYHDRSLEVWQATSWGRLIGRLRQYSGLSDDEFERFLHSLHVLHGSAADFVLFHKLSPDQARLAGDIARLLPTLVTNASNKDRWSREELLRELGWRDPAKTRHIHRFPVGAYVQRNRDTELGLLHVLHSIDQGYVALVGPPGSGKSTLLQATLTTEPDVRLVRYLAFMPGTAQGVGRGEANDFLDDLSTQMRNGGLIGLRLRDSSQHERREQFGAFLVQAGERYEHDGVRTIIVVDGLDHVPREEMPVHSMLAELPLPAAVPKGVVFVLGTQRLDLAHLKPAVQEQAAKPGRIITMRPLERDAVARMADTLGLDPSVSRQRLNELSHGHPLATRYLIQALLRANEIERTHLLAGGMDFNGDIESVYASAWREIANDLDAILVLGFIARVEAPISLSLLATVVEERAIEHALRTVRHLLKETPQGWSIFHNSFRLFVLSKPRVRLGSIDAAYSQQVYRKLATLARTAPAESLQRWLEMRYLARADDRDELLALATPMRFRQQLAQGRAVSEIEFDIRLALLAARSTIDGTIVTRLLLCRDEVSRRTTALEYADQLPLAMLAVGDVDAAMSFVQDFPKMGYEVVDALLERGEFEGAKELFEHLEPLSQLHTHRFQNHGPEHNLQEFERWARRVFHFRDFEQIQQSIYYLADEGMRQTPGATPEETIASVCERLRVEVAEAILSSKPDVSIHDVCTQLRIEQTDFASMMIQAGFAAKKRGEGVQALTLFIDAIKLPGFDETHNSWRRSMALFAAVSGREDVATELFDKLIAPAISMGDDEPHSTSPSYLVQAVVEHAQLCTLLGKPQPNVVSSRHPVLQPLQAFATNVGVLMGQAVIDATMISAGSVQQACRSSMGYILRLRPKAGSDFYLVDSAVIAAPVMARLLIQVGAKCGETEYRAVLHEIDKVISTTSLKGTMLLRREVAIAAYRVDGDSAAAKARLEPMISELVENTPSEQLDSLADLAIAFASVGNIESAKGLLASVPDHCLGYALAARKDPQYTVWRDVLVLANNADSAQRAQRVSQLMQQVDGMKETEGASAANRLTMVLIDEAMQINARYGNDLAHTLMDWQLITWPNRIDAQLIGLLRRRPELLRSCISIWCGLCLPFYMEPHYRDPANVGDFIEAAVETAGSSLATELVPMLQHAIEVDGRAHERLLLLQRLSKAAAKQGYLDHRLESAIRRWASEGPPPRQSYSKQKYDDASTLQELQAEFEVEVAGLDFNAPYRFIELAKNAPIEQVQQMFERWDVLQSHTRCRFMVVKRLVQAGEIVHAQKIIKEYENGGIQRSSWSQMMGGDKFRYFEARKLLEGATMQREAYESFVDSLVANEDGSMLLLAEIDSILPVICANPNWPEIWSMLAEQMASTREYQLGDPFEVFDEPLSDEEFLAELLCFALKLPIEEVHRHAHSCALQLAKSGGGEVVFELAMRRLLVGDLDAPLHALLILLDLKHNLTATLGSTVESLVNHRDIGVAEAATLLITRWGGAVLIDTQQLPLFYHFELPGDLGADDTLLDKPSGAMRVEDALGWTNMLRPIAQALADAADSDEINIRQRAAMFIHEWGGLDSFGLPGLNRLESLLRTLSMKITYYKPHGRIAIIALRHVAGELRRAGLLSRRDMPSILERLDTPLPPLPFIDMHIRPSGIRRPLAVRNGSWREAEQLWADQVDSDLTPWAERIDEYVVAEVTRFKIHEARRSEYRLYRICAPQLGIDSDSFWDWYSQLPAALWLGQMVAFDDELAPTLVRRIVSSFCRSVPAYPFTFCPNWLRRLRWRAHDDNPLVYVGPDSSVVARLTHWRDAGPADIDDNFLWGEGVYVSLTTAGLQQFKAAQGNLVIGGFARREVKIFLKNDTKIVSTAQHNYLI